MLFTICRDIYAFYDIYIYLTNFFRFVKIAFQAVAVEIKHDDKLTEDEGVYIQAALLYTSCGGIRRLRILNLSLKTSSQMAELYRTCDLDAIVNYFSKQSKSFLTLTSTPCNFCVKEKKTFPTPL